MQVFDNITLVQQIKRGEAIQTQEFLNVCRLILPVVGKPCVSTPPTHMAAVVKASSYLHGRMKMKAHQHKTRCGESAERGVDP